MTDQRRKKKGVGVEISRMPRDPFNEDRSSMPIRSRTSPEAVNGSACPSPQRSRLRRRGRPAAWPARQGPSPGYSSSRNALRFREAPGRSRTGGYLSKFDTVDRPLSMGISQLIACARPSITAPWAIFSAAVGFANMRPNVTSDVDLANFRLLFSSTLGSTTSGEGANRDG